MLSEIYSLILSIFIQLGDQFYGALRPFGVVGLGIGTLLESFGIPTAGIVLQLASGSMILSGDTTFIVALAIATLGLTIGSVASYYVGFFGIEAIHRTSKKKGEQSSRMKDFLIRHGDLAIFLAQFFGPARTWISLPAGALKLDIKRFTIFTFLGGAFYCAIAISLSLYATQLLRTNFAEYIERISLPLVAGIVFGIVFAFVIWRALTVDQSHSVAEINE